MKDVNNDTKSAIIIHYGELGLKGGNRPRFIVQLVENIKVKLKTLKLDWPVSQYHGYLIITPPTAVDLTPVLNELQKVFGIAWIASANTLNVKKNEFDLNIIDQHFLDMVKTISAEDKTFAINARRANKTFPINSQEIEVRLGRLVQEQTDWQKVNLDNPDQTFYIDVYNDGIYFYTEKIIGFDGLPVGTAGNVISLLSGGIDSPVASWLMAKRGTQVDLLHFAATNMQIKEASNYLISQISQQLSTYLRDTRLFIVPYTHFNLAILNKRTNYELVLFRRFMVRVAEKLAIQLKAQAIVTGDNLAQVASQTMPNLVATSMAVDMPILRPLLTYNKHETINLAKQIDTFELSIQPYKDCCSLISRNPKIQSFDENLSQIETDIIPDYNSIIEQTLNEVVVLEYKDGQLIT